MEILLASAATLKDIERLINKYFYSDSYYLDDSFNITHKLSGEVLKNFRVVKRKNRYRFEGLHNG